MKEFTFSIEINSSQEEIYNALTNSFQIELWTGYTAVMDENPGTIFSLWEGDITGCNLEIIKDYKIVQEWFFGETKNPSIVTMLIKKAGSKSRIELSHTNIPDDTYDEIVDGWKDYYLGSVKSFLEFY